MIRTGYSFKTAVGHLPEVMARLKALGWTHAPIADRNSTFGFARWTKLAQANELLPVYGVELGVTKAISDAKLQTLDHWTFLAIDNLRSLHDLVAMATSHKVPSLTYAQAMAAPELIKITGERTLLDCIAPADDLFVGLSPATPRGLYRAALERGFRFVAMSNNVYPEKADKEFFRVTLGRHAGTQSYPQHIMTDQEWSKAIPFADEAVKVDAIAARGMILAQCKAKMKTATLLTPEKKKTLRAMCEEGAALLGVDLTNETYASRLKHELEIIHEKKFEDYFYIIAEMVQWAKARMIVGPGRGSSSGSLVCYLLGITAIDPIPHGLLFERFLDLTRTDLPDIDLDFSDVNRYKVFEHAEKIYGKDHVARLGTVGMFKPRSALNLIGVALRIPRSQIEKVLDNIIVRSSGDSRANQQLEDTLTATEAGRALMESNPEVVIAGRMEGHPNNASQHAAGIIITQEPIVEYVAVDQRTNAAMCDKKDAETLQLLKIDALGLKQLSVFEHTLELIGEKPVSGWLEKIPLDDPAAFDVLNNGHFCGVFQFMGRSLKNLVKQSGVRNFDDMVAITALARPGPMGTGGAGSWAKRRAGKEAVTYPHEMLKPYLEETLGVVTMQEQVMRIGREIGDLTWKDVTALRKAMSKSLGTEYFDQFGDRWKAAAIAKGMPQDIANAFWKDLCAFGLWGFNKSHAVAYAMISYWCCWLKAYHSVEFAAATLSAESDIDRQIELLRELRDEGIGYIPVDIDRSTERWEPIVQDGKRCVIGPLQNIRGIGPVAVREILEARAAGLPIADKHVKRLTNPSTEIDTLFPVREKVSQVDLAKLNIVSKAMDVKDVQCGVSGSVMIIAVLNKLAPRDENEAVNVAKRGGRVYNDGFTKSLNLFFKDDTDEIFCKIDRFKFDRLGQAMIERGRVGTAIYAVKGTVPRDFRMIKVENIKYICDLDHALETPEREAGRNAKRFGDSGMHVND